MSNKKFSPPTPRMVFILLGVLTLLFIVGGYTFYRHETNVVEIEKYNDLRAIADLKTRQIVSWRQERQADAGMFSTGSIRKNVLEWLKDGKDPAALETVIRDRLQMLRNYQGYDNLILVGIDGRLLLTMNPALTNLEPTARQLAARAISSRNVIFGELFRCPECNRVHLDVAAPIFGDGNLPIAVFILRSDPMQTLYPLIGSWPMPSQSAETLIVRKDGDDILFLNTLRHRPDPPLTIRIPISTADLPAARAALGRTDLFRGHDYRDVDVLTDIRPVPASPWFMVTKVDTDEFLSEVRYRGITIGLFTLMLILLAGTCAGYIYKHQGKRAFQALYRAERDQREAEEEIKTTLYSIGDAVITTDVEGRIRRVNPVAENLTGWTEKDAKGKPVEDVFRIIAEATGEKVDSPVQKVLEKGLIVGLANHTLLISKNGDRIPIADSGAPIQNETGDITGVVLVFRDQTRERDIDRMLRVRLKLLEYAQTHSLDALLQKTIDEACALTNSPLGFYHFVEADQQTIALQAWSTRTVREFCAAAGKGLHYPLDRAGVWSDCVHAKKPVIHNDYNSLPHRKGLPDGHAPVTRELVVPIMRSGRVVSILGVGNKDADYTQKDVELTTYIADVAWEITGRRRDADLLRESEARFRLLYENAPVAYHSLDVHGNILNINDTWLAELGYTREEVIGKWFGDFLLEEGRAEFVSRFDEYKSSGKLNGLEVDLRHKDGRIISVSFEGRIARDANGAFLRSHCVFVNITERKRMEESLRSEKLFSDTMIQSLPGIFYLFDEAGHFLRWNKNFEIVSGYSSKELKELKELHPLDFFSGEEKKRVGAAIQEVFAKGQSHVEADFISKDGGKTPHYFTGLTFISDNRPYLVGMGIDIAKRKTMEDQLRQAQKMDSVGRLAGGVAHDFNNMLMVIIGNSEMALQQTDPEQPVFKDIQEILKAARRSANLTRQLLAFARKQTIRPVVLDLNDAISSMLKLLRQLIGENIDLTWKPGPNIWPVTMDPAQIDQILANLLVNARDAIGGVGSVTIETDNVEFDESYCAVHAGFISGQYAMLAVSDTGAGMDKETLGHLFEPFFTTKEMGKGTGLGLATVYGIVKQNNGFINVYSEPGQGTTVKIYLPRTKTGITEKTVAETGKGKNLQGTETVLLVEDEKSILKLGISILEKYGYTVLSAKTPVEALDLATSYDKTIHLLLTDVVMPGMNGQELRKKLNADRPGIKCLFMSGYTANAIAHHGVLDNDINFLQKPFSVATMAKKIREILDGKDSV